MAALRLVQQAAPLPLRRRLSTTTADSYVSSLWTRLKSVPVKYRASRSAYLIRREEP